MTDATHSANGAAETVDVAILLRASWSEAVGHLRRFQVLVPSFRAPVRLTQVPGDLVAVLVEPAHATPLRVYLGRLAAYRGTCGWRRPGERRAPIVVNGDERSRAPEIRVWRNPEQPRPPVRVGVRKPGALHASGRR